MTNEEQELNRRKFLASGLAISGLALTPAGIFAGDSEMGGITKEKLHDATQLIPERPADFVEYTLQRNDEFDTLLFAKMKYGIVYIDSDKLKCRPGQDKHSELFESKYYLPSDHSQSVKHWELLHTKAYSCHRDDLDSLRKLLHESHSEMIRILEAELEQGNGKWKSMTNCIFSNNDTAYGFSNDLRRELYLDRMRGVVREELHPLDDPEHPVNDLNLISWRVQCYISAETFEPEYQLKLHRISSSRIDYCAEVLQEFCNMMRHRNPAELVEADAGLKQVAEMFKQMASRQIQFIKAPEFDPDADWFNAPPKPKGAISVRLGPYVGGQGTLTAQDNIHTMVRSGLARLVKIVDSLTAFGSNVVVMLPQVVPASRFSDWDAVTAEAKEQFKCEDDYCFELVCHVIEDVGYLTDAAIVPPPTTRDLKLLSVNLLRMQEFEGGQRYIAQQNEQSPLPSIWRSRDLPLHV